MNTLSAKRDLSGKHVTVVGLGRSGRMAIELLVHLGARVTAVDEKPRAEMSDVAGQLTEQGIVLYFDEDAHLGFAEADLVVISPGVPFSSPFLDDVRHTGTPIIAEIELAFPYLEGRLVGVTGTNGKSTTVTLAGAMLEQAGIPVRVGGNLGIPLSQIALDCLRKLSPSPQYVIAELSSFQLETIDAFTPWLAVVLNITGDHMDRYPTFDDYVMAKARLFRHQDHDDYSLLNEDDSVVRPLGSLVLSSLMTFSREREVNSGMYIDDGRFMWRVKHQAIEVCSLDEIKLQGAHNIENAMAAASIALLCGASVEVVRGVLQTFSGLEHAYEHVQVCRGVTFINDSKATNVAATTRALESVGHPIVLIAGGRDKASDFSALARAIQRYVKALVLIGESGEKIQAALDAEHGPSLPIYFGASLESAIQRAHQEANAGDVVLFSPACASFDMFQDYRHRGNQFKEAVHALS